MYNPRSFRILDLDTIVTFMRRHSFATVVTSREGQLQASHLPLMVRDGDPGKWPVLLGHLARANPQWRDMDGSSEGLIVFHGPHGYVSPSQYEVHPSVPTWNYQVVHAYGTPRLVQDAEEIGVFVRDLVAEHEAGSERPWRPDWPLGYLDGMLKQIVGFTIPLTRVEAKFKLSQNRPIADRANVAAAFESSPDTTLRELGIATRKTLQGS